MDQEYPGQGSGKDNLEQRLFVVHCNHIRFITITHSVHDRLDYLLLFLLRQVRSEFEAKKAIVADVKCPLGASCEGGDFVEPAPKGDFPPFDLPDSGQPNASFAMENLVRPPNDQRILG